MSRRILPAIQSPTPTYLTMTKREAKLVAAVWAHYRAHGRHDLPWRRTTDPYRIAVSELMLQQTQVARVVPKYQAFIRRFPNTKQLATAPLGDVLALWQGLGYNRRAQYLHQTAQKLCAAGGRWPRSVEGLQQLPGIGPYTAGAIAAFAYNQPVSIIETNIRTVYLYHLFPGRTDVSEAELQDCVSRTVDHERPREWYWALMDYGTYVKERYGNQNQRAATYQKQSPFRGSVREVRGAVIRALSSDGWSSTAALLALFPETPERVESVLHSLQQEGLVVPVKNGWSLPH